MWLLRLLGGHTVIPRPNQTIGVCKGFQCEFLKMAKGGPPMLPVLVRARDAAIDARSEHDLAHSVRAQLRGRWRRIAPPVRREISSNGWGCC
jgi:hypothetical protein